MTSTPRTWTPALCLVILGLAALPVRGQDPGPCDQPLLEVEVEDQFQRERATKALLGTVSVIVWADRGASDWSGTWSEMLSDGLQGQIGSGLVQVRGWAHTKGAPFFVKGRIRRSFPDDPAAWTYLDWDGMWKEHYEPREDHVTVYVFDRAGCLVARETGTAVDAAAVARVVRAAQEVLIRDHEAATGEASRTGEIHR